MPGVRIPYPGLRSFERDDIDVFFGRDECIDGMLARLRETQFLAVLGASGTGKSSLVKTGLLSALGMGLIGGAGSRWRVVVVRPGDEPLRNLARALVASVLGASGETAAEPCKSAAAVEALRGQLAGRGAEAVVAWCRAALAEGENLLIIADQFEQLFKSRGSRAQDEAEFFATLLLESARAVEGGIFVTITMRSEYLGPCALIEGLAEAIAAGMYLVPRMTREQCRQAIEGPAKVFGGSVAEPLVNVLLNDLARLAPWDEGGDEDQLDRLARRADQLPLLQFALNRMWVAAAARAGEGPVVLELADYEAVGGLKGALNSSAETILKELGERRRPVVRGVFAALTAGTTIADATSNPLHYQELVAICGAEEREVRAVVNAFRARGCDFLLPGLGAEDVGAETPIEPDTRIEITHESLIRQWRGLSSWLEGEGRAGQRWRRLKEDADQRFETGLLGGQRLAAIKEWRRREWPNAAWAKRYGDDYERVTKFVDASLDAESRQKLRRYALVGVVAAVVVVAGFWGWRQRVHAVATATADKVDSGYRRAAETFAYGLPGKMEPLLNGDSDMSGRASPQAIQQLAIAQAQLLDAMWNINQHDNVFLTAEIQTLRFSLPLIAEKDDKASAGRLATLATVVFKEKPLKDQDLDIAFFALDAITQNYDQYSDERTDALAAANEEIKEVAAIKPAGKGSYEPLYLTSYGYWRKGQVLWDMDLLGEREDRLGEAAAAFRQGIQIGDTWQHESGDVCQALSADLHNDLAQVLTQAGQRKGYPQSSDAGGGAIAEYRSALDCDAAKQKVDDSEINRQWVANRASWLAQAEEDAGLFAQAKKDFEQALNVRMQVATSDAGNPQATRDVASSLRSLGYLLTDEGDPAGAVLYFNECKQQIETLGARSAASEYANNIEALGLCERGLGVALRRLGRDKDGNSTLPEAAAAFRASIDDLDAAARRGNDETGSLEVAWGALTGTLILGGDAGGGSAAAVKEAASEAMRLDAQILAGDRSAYQQTPTVNAAVNLANDLGYASYNALMAGKPDVALRYATEAAALPVNPSSDTRINMAHAYLLNGDVSEAEALYAASKGRPDQLAGIKEDFAIFTNVGIAVPAMEQVRKELGI
ncbi:MAG TPA: hypothetical protein VMF62_06600 [Acetobacteraceae bacterium]|nr:hypothetical protein [Acetobacteraceae bacterium]